MPHFVGSLSGGLASRNSEFEILWSIVRAVPVFVMNMLRRQERATNLLFHDVAVHCVPSTLDLEVVISGIVGSTAFPAWVRGPALWSDVFPALPKSKAGAAM